MDNSTFQQQQDGTLNLQPTSLANSADERRNQTYPQLYQQTHAQPIWSPYDFHTLEDSDIPQQPYIPTTMQQQQSQQQQQQPHQHLPQTHPQPQQQQPQRQTSRPASRHARQPALLQTDTMSMAYTQGFNRAWQLQLGQAMAAQQAQQQLSQMQTHQEHLNGQYGVQDDTAMNAAMWAAYASTLQTSPVDMMPANVGQYNAINAAQDQSAMAALNILQSPMESMNTLGYQLDDYSLQLNNHFDVNVQNALNHSNPENIQAALSTGSPTGTILEVVSLSDNEWSAVNFNSNRQSLDSLSGTVSNPSLNLHIRSGSDSSSSEPESAQLSGSYEEIPPWPLGSPQDEYHSQNYIDSHFIQHGLPIPGVEAQQASPSSLEVSPTTNNHGTFQQASSSTSPSSTGSGSPPTRRRKSPSDKVATKVIVKKTAHSTRKDATAEKRVGKRRGPLRPEQRQQAHEIRKLRACLRCKFLKKVCDKGEPCGGCRPSHARLWQVPCTRLDIKDIAYFMKDWKADYERHVSLGFSVNNIKGFSNVERKLYITHGYGHYMPINAREIFVREDKCFDVNWVESIHESPREFEVNTAKLSAGIEGISLTQLSDYLDLHLDSGFESFIDEYFEGTAFLTEILKTVYNYYLKTKTPCIRKALKLVLAYNLTLHLTMVVGLSEEEQFIGRIEDPGSKFNGKTFAPVMINFQIKCALADMWRELQKDVLEELSSLYSSVYSGEKLKNWPTIFMLATILLAIWEEMQFDCHYRVPDEKVVNKFCDDMESTPVGVIVGLFQAISTKLPAIYEWDTRKHQYLLGSDTAICDALTEVREHIHKYETYLRDRATTAKFDRNDFDCLSNKFLSKLVIRAN